MTLKLVIVLFGVLVMFNVISEMFVGIHCMDGWTISTVALSFVMFSAAVSGSVVVWLVAFSVGLGAAIGGVFVKYMARACRSIGLFMSVGISVVMSSSSSNWGAARLRPLLSGKGIVIL